MRLTMNRFTKVVGGALLATTTFLSGQVMAQGTPPVVCPGYKKGPSSIPGQRVGKKIQQAFEFYSNDQLDEALTILLDIETKQKFDRAYTDRFIGNLMAAKDGKGKEALKFLERAVQQKNLNDVDHAGTLRLLGDLSMQEKMYEGALKWYDAWMGFTCKEDADVYVRIAQAHYETKNLPAMIEPANKAIALYEKPNKNPYVLKMTSYFERKIYPETIEVAEQLVSIFPDNKQWWTQLGFFYMLVEDFKKGLSTFEMAYLQGYLEKESEIKALSQLYATNDMPYKSAVLLEKYLKDGLVKREEQNVASLANTWQQAREYDKAAYWYGEAAKISDKPYEHLQRQGTLLLNNEQYDKAVAVLEKSLDGTDKPGRIHMALMEAHFYQGRFKEAYVHVREAAKINSTRRNAKAWEPYIKEKAKNRGIKI